MSRRAQVAMTDDEVTAFLAEQRTAHFGTISRDGAPHLTTLWYGLVDGKVAVWTYGKSQKIRNLERDPRITALIESGDAYSELRGVMLRGRASLSSEPEDVMRVAEAVYLANGERFGAVQYQGEALDRGTRDVLGQMSTKRVAIIVEPETVVSWDHRKLGGVY